MTASGVTLLIAQTMVEYGALAGASSSLQRFLQAADDTVRNPRTGVPLAIVAVIAAYFLLRPRR